MSAFASHKYTQCECIAIFVGFFFDLNFVLESEIFFYLWKLNCADSYYALLFTDDFISTFILFHPIQIDLVPEMKAEKIVRKSEVVFFVYKNC